MTVSRILARGTSSSGLESSCIEGAELRVGVLSMRVLVAVPLELPPVDLTGA